MQRPCDRKEKRFDTEREALDALADIIKLSILGTRRREYHAEVAVYECPHCARWHLTSMPYGNEIVVRGQTMMRMVV